LRDDDKNNGTKHTLNATAMSKRSQTRELAANETVIGKKQKENKARIYRIETTDLLYFPKFIAGWPKFSEELFT